MKLKNKAVYLVSIISLLGGLTGCGNNKSDGVEVIFWHTFGKTIITELESHISEFEDYIKQTEGKKVKVTLKDSFTEETPYYYPIVYEIVLIDVNP